MARARKTKKKKLPKPLRDELKRRNILPASVADRKMSKSVRAEVKKALAAAPVSQPYAYDRFDRNTWTILNGLMAEAREVNRRDAAEASQRAEKHRESEPNWYEPKWYGGTHHAWLTVKDARERGIVENDPLLNIGPGIYGRA